MQVPHITKLLNELENIATADWKKWDIPNATANDFVTWAQSRATHTYNEVKAEIALAEQSQEQYLTASEARKLVESGCRAQWLHPDYPLHEVWLECFHGVTYSDRVIKYRAIKQPEPAEPTSAEYARGYAEGFNDACKPKVEPHAELKALYAHQVKDGTLDNFVWYVNRGTGSGDEIWSGGKSLPEIIYSIVCTPKPTCQVRNPKTFGDYRDIEQETVFKESK